MKKNIIIGVVLFLILLGIFFNKIILNPEDAVTINADLLKMTSVWEKQINQNINESNELPLWNPDVYSGTPFIGNPLIPMFYPLSFVFYFVPFHSAFWLVMLVNVLLMSIFFYMYLRLIRISRFSSLFSLVIFVFSGMVMLWAGIVSFINALIWFPLLLYLSERLIVEKRMIFGLVMGIVFGVQILGGGPQISLYSSFVVFLYIMLRLLQERKGISKTIMILLAAGIVGILISAVQLIPMLEYSKYSIRDSKLDYDTATMHSLPGYALITFFMPEFFGRGNLYWGFWKNSSFAEQYIYVGLTTLMLLLVAICFARKNKYAGIFAIIALFSLLFSFGKYTPFYSIFYNLPLFSSVRVPVRMMIFFVFSAAVISGLSLDALKEFDEEKKKKLKRILYILGLIAAIAAVISVISYINYEKIIESGKEFATKLYAENANASRITRSGLSQDYFRSLVPSVLKNIFRSISIFLALSVSILFVFYLWVQNEIRLKHLNWLLLIILIAELFLFSSKFVVPNSFEEKFQTNPIIDIINKDDGIFRVLSLRNYQTRDNLPQYLAVYNGMEIASGCDAIFLRKYAEYSCAYGDCEVKADACIPIANVKNGKMIDMLNIKYVVSPTDVDDGSLRFIINHNGANLYKNLNYLSRAYYVPLAKYASDKTESLKTLTDADFEPMRYVVIESNGKEFEVDSRGDYKSLVISKHSANKVIIEDDFDNNGFVVLSDVYYPGWKAFVDGREVKVYSANYIVKGIYVEKGHHKIEFVYKPISYKAGLYISLITLLAVIVLVFRPKLLWQT